MTITLKPIYLAFVAVFIAGVLGVLAVAALLSDGGGTELQSGAVADQTATSSPVPPLATETAFDPDPTATPVVRSCEVILDSGVYVSQAEKRFFLENCLPDPDPTVVAE